MRKFIKVDGSAVGYHRLAWNSTNQRNNFVFRFNRFFVQELVSASNKKNGRI